MKSFNVLERNEKIHRHAVIEASAGTGKTFAIENIVVRLLIDPGLKETPPPLEKILVVTFTRAAARDLKIRIRANLEKSLNALNRFICDNTYLDNIPDYLYAHIEAGLEAATLARRRIEKALFSFDQAQLFTIHGFCWRMLRSYAIEAGIGLGTEYEEGGTQVKAKLLQAVRDFLRTELIPEIYSSQQIKIVLRKFNGQVERLQTELLKAISKGPDVIAPPNIPEYIYNFQNAMSLLKTDHGLTSDKIKADFLLQAPCYKDLNDKSKKVKQEVLDKIDRFSRLFDKDCWTAEDFDILIEDGLYITEALVPEKLLARCKLPDHNRLHYPRLLELLETSLSSTVNHARNANLIFARMAADCQKLLRNYQDQEELLGYNELVEKMRQASSDVHFTSKVRGCYEAAIVDEFQDTDPVQWEVFRKLFADAGPVWEGFLYLVGDPKQSIYAFRQADIYTYLSAADAIGNESASTLDTNYRSQPALVDALNTLFESASRLFPLPRLDTYLPYKRVKAGRSGSKTFSDGRPCLQFWLADDAKRKKPSHLDYEADFFFPAIAQEILRLHCNDGVSFRQCAVLVSDRFQAERLMLFFRKRGIPVISQRGVNLAASRAVDSLRELLKGILNYRHASSLKVALGGIIIGMDHEAILANADEISLNPILEQCEILRKVLVNEGFASFYPLLMCSCWHEDGKSVTENLVTQSGGVEFYAELQDVAELLILEQNQKDLSANGLLEFLNSFDMLASNDDDRMKVFTNQEQDGVPILTSHVSKGLEFDVVFTLGLIKRNEIKDALIPMQQNGRIFLAGMPDKDSASYKEYYLEIDAEKMRQLYVAFTRAKYRLYVPVAMRCGGDHVEHGEASPTELFLARLGETESNKLDYNALYAKVNAGSNHSLAALASAFPDNMMLVNLEKSSCDTCYNEDASLPTLLPPSIVEVSGSARFVQSFTSLAKHFKLAEEEDHTIAAPHDLQTELKNAHTLPAGSETGVLLHGLFEDIPFQTFKNMSSPGSLLPLVQEKLEGTALAGWHDVVADIMYRTFTTSLQCTESPFCLADVDPKKIFRETEFLFSSDEAPELANVPLRPGYIKGVIDLFFEHEGKYYLLDWKSNWLGPSSEYYCQESLESAMIQNDYKLQAIIYTAAMKRYLKLFDKRPFEPIFGGAYYCFLRGIGPGTGIYHWTK